jgi:hypothetical protein
MEIVMTTKSIRLSNTAITTFQQCGMKYKYHYIDRYRTKLIDSPLFFGNAIDNAINVQLLSKKKNLTDSEKELASKDYKLVFRDALQNVAIVNSEASNNKSDIRKSELARYFNSDLDLDIWTESDLNEFFTNSIPEMKHINKSNYKAFIDECLEVRKKKELLDMPEYRLFNFACWISLHRKGLILLEEYKKTILPEIIEVHDIQKEVHLPNEKGDFITGYIDFIATFKDGIKRVMDNKTSSSAYTHQNILDSQQLVIYTENQKNYKCGFAVLEKKLRKKEPRVRSYLIFGEISDIQVEKAFSEIEYVLEDIKAEKFEKNEKSCFAFGKPCAYYDLCHKGDSKGLVKLGEKK